MESPATGEHLISAREIWQECRNLPADTWSQTLYYLATPSEQGNNVPITVRVGSEGDESRLIFHFGIDEENVFVANAIHGTSATEEGIDLFGSYTYAELKHVIEALAGPGSGFIEIKRKNRIAPTSPPEQDAMPRQTPPSAMETLAERVERLRRESFRAYYQRIAMKRAEPGFEGKVGGIILKRYNQGDRLFNKIRTIKPGDTREYWGSPALELRCTMSMPLGQVATNIEEATGQLVKTLVLRVLFGTSRGSRDSVVPLHDQHVETLAAFVEEMKNLDTPLSHLRSILQENGFKQVKLEFAANVNPSIRDEGRGGGEYRVIPIDEAPVPEKRS